MNVSRRDLIGFVPLGLALASEDATVPESFPTQPSALAREIVAVAHGNFKRVRELVEARPSLAKAGWDCGFGDWETPLGAASHSGSREIAEFLIAHSARPTLFSATMLGHLEVVKAFIAAEPGVQRISGPHSISLLAHAKAGGPAAEPVLKYLESLGDAGAVPAVPLTEEEMAALSGTYAFGSGPNERIEISVNGGQLMFLRMGTMGRGLFHKGNHVFYPAGASAVKIRLDGKVVTVHDPDLVLTARRV